MGREVHVTRREHSCDGGNDIGLDEWMACIESSVDMERDEEETTGIWTGHSKRGIDDHRAWFACDEGVVYTEKPDFETLRRTFAIARHFDASVRSDDGDMLDEAEAIASLA